MKIIALLITLVCSFSSLISVQTTRVISQEDAQALFKFYAVTTLKVLSRDVDGLRSLCAQVHESWCLLDQEISLVELASKNANFNDRYNPGSSCVLPVTRFFADRKLRSEGNTLSKNFDKYAQTIGAIIGEPVPTFAELKSQESKYQQLAGSNHPAISLSDTEIAFLQANQREPFVRLLRKRKHEDDEMEQQSAKSELVRTSSLRSFQKRSAIGSFGQFLFGIAQFAFTWTIGLFVAVALLFVTLFYAGIMGALGFVLGCCGAVGACALGSCALAWDCLTCRGCCGACPASNIEFTGETCCSLCGYPFKCVGSTCRATGATASLEAAWNMLAHLPLWSVKGFGGLCSH